MDNEKKLDQLEEKIKQLQNQKKAILMKEKEKERKARTKRLIQIGSLFEKYFKSEEHSIDVIEEFLKEIMSGEDAEKEIQKIFDLAKESDRRLKCQKEMEI